MESSRSNGLLLIIAGLIVAVACGGADELGLGITKGFGYLQGVGTLVGILGILYGAHLTKADGKILIVIGIAIIGVSFGAQQLGLSQEAYSPRHGLVTFLGVALFGLGYSYLTKKKK